MTHHRILQKFLKTYLAFLAMVLLLDTDIYAWQIKDLTFFPVTYWNGPPIAYTTDERYQEVADCNITVAGVGIGVSYFAVFSPIINFAQQKNFHYMVLDGRQGENYPNNPSDAALQAMVNDYKDGPNMFGYLLTDEPSAAVFPWIAYVVQKLREKDPKHIAYINLLPNHASAAQMGRPSYAEYIQYFFETVHPDVISFDHYLYLYYGGAGNLASLCQNLETVRNYSLQYDTPYWWIGYSMDDLPDHQGTPIAWGTMSQYLLDFQAYIGLVYGYTSYSHFAYWNEWAGGNNAIVNPPKTYIYDFARILNGQLKNIGLPLLSVVSQKVYHVNTTPPSGTTKFLANTDALVKDVTYNSNVIVGTFKGGQSRDMVMFMNKNNANNTINVRLKPGQVVE